MFHSRRSQRGVILLMLLIALTLIIIAMAVAAPKLKDAIKRDREIEMIHRGTQYARAVKKYYKKFGRYPSTIEQLENTNNIRFLRKRYTDPMAKDGKWRPVQFGDLRQLGSQGGGPGLIGGAGGVLPPVVGGALNQSGTGFSQGTGIQTTTQNQQSNFGTSSTFSSGTSFGTQGSTTSGFGSQTQSGSASGQPSGFGQPGQTFGGGAILGVASTSKKKGFHEYNQKAEYDKWLFIYDPNQDRGGLITGPYNPKAFVGNAAPVGQPNQQPSSTFGNPPSNSPGGFSNNPAPSQPSGGQPNP